ncbi:hypothetical protein J2R98_001868 [Alkalibacillus filiformis]|uniref:Superinfection immunity protein n=1 Tax=Alkalibacillus filiformis TaxID=200990 RepID=A0ABU0DUA0_9BACI|nr:superinfection immunity protein [Alkalibacillus filiformis]MDQ0352034.1 hypothetical protein [Alkalibacillus filiformis]
MDTMIGLLGLAFFIAIHFIPSYIAIKRNKHNRVMIFCINAFLSWNVVGWFVALYLALKDDPQDKMYNAVKPKRM